MPKSHHMSSAAVGAAFAVTAAGAISLFLAQPAEAASFRCVAAATIDDAGPASDITTAAPCALEAGPGERAHAATFATAGLLRANTSAETTVPAFASGLAYGEAVDDVLVSGLGEEGATLNFRVSVDGFLRANASSPTPPLFQAAAAASDVISLVSLSSSAGANAMRDIRACARNAESSISTCNGDFNYLVGDSVTVDALMPLSIFVRNGDSLRIFMSLRTSSLAKTTDPAHGAASTADFGHTMYWDGLVFDEASRNVVLTSTSGFDYRYSALPDTVGGVPEPATWALMIAGFGLAGAALRRRRAIAA